MPPREKSQLKRARDSPNYQDSDLAKKPRRSERLSHKPDADNERLKTPIITNQLPSPVTHQATGSDRDGYKEPTAEPPEGRPSQVTHRTPEESQSQPQGFSSPPQDTQAFPTSQYVDADGALSDEVQDEVKEGVWGYLFPLDTRYGGQCIVLKKRNICPHPKDVANARDSKKKDGTGKCALEQEESYEKSKTKGVPSGGYLIGRHPECAYLIRQVDVVIDHPIISNRHCLLFTENKGDDTIAVMEDLSSNGTFVNEAIVGLDLIDHMLVVEPEKRYTVNQCLQHPWLTQKMPMVADSTDGLVDGIGGLDVHRRGVVRERTLLSSINSVHLSRKVPLGPNSKQPLKIYTKNPTAQNKPGLSEPRPADERATEEFVQMGGRGDQELFANDSNTFYSTSEATAAKDTKPKGKGKGKVNGR
ncbi:hypothetical protein RRF57_000256 [Xylaria bambusicola]|uniref:FHA domain-containing protein n=1 Tax=Xylaria bambusicola TaxID=326684 RepID=A0AAN7U3A9_9PEZI